MTDPADRYERCSGQAALRGDPMTGSAFPASRLLLVEQPGPWGRAGLLASRFDTGIAHRLVARWERLGIRVVAIRRPGRHVGDGARRWAAVDCRPDRERIVWGRFAADRDLLELDVPGLLDRPSDASAEVDPVYLVCAHGTHDACCAILGRPVAAALEAERPGRVWECSHVGGDRFAANVLILPSGLLYGRVRAEQAADLVRRTDAGTVDPAGLRGRVGFPSAEQAAMVRVLSTCPDVPIPAGLAALGASRSAATPSPTPSSTPRPVSTAAADRTGCDAAYPTVCVPPSPPDLDCRDISDRRFVVLAPDPHRFDGNGDGVGCEMD